MQAENTGTGATAAQRVLERLGQIEVGESVVHERVAIFPLFASGGNADAAARYRTLEQALGAGEAEVTERPSATVPELVLRNKGQQMLLVLDGEEIIGGLQNRIVNASFLVAAETTVALPVSCVERGRWHDVAPTFAVGESSYQSLRRMKHAQVTESLRASGRHMSDQGAIWASVDSTAQLTGSFSPSGAMHDIYRNRTHDLSAYQQALGYVAGACGLLVALNGRVVGGDVFDQPVTAETLWPKLVRSYVLDALAGDPGAQAERDNAVQILARAQGARCEVFPSLALGEDVRFEGDHIIGGGLVYHETPIHISLFGTEGDGEPEGRTRHMTRVMERRAWQQRARPAGPAPADQEPAQGRDQDG
jgi:hypothetical protein